MRYSGRILAALAVSTGILAAASALAQQAESLVIREQGSFFAGGSVASTPGTYDNNAPSAEGQSIHGDHLYAFYQIPQDARPTPIVMLHGAMQSARSWETTPDGREGFQTLFLRKGYPVYLVDQLFFDQFRFGIWPDYFEGVQGDQSPETLEQFLRSVKAAGESADVAQSMIVTVWNIGIAGGGIVGGLVLDSWA